MTDAAEFINGLPGWFLTVLVLGCGMIITSLVGLMVAFLKSTWVDLKVSNKKQTEAVIGLTLSIQKLEIKVEYLSDLLNIIPKLKSDVDHAHSKIRELDGRRP